MKYILLLTAVILVFLATNFSHGLSSPEVTKVEIATSTVSKVYEPTHAQTVWLHALEWCESAGNKSAINPEDKDHTPSYYSFQFKPSTFKAYALKYEILKKEDVDTSKELMEQLKNYNNQFQVVASMINDPSVRWRSQFPGCVAKLGLPPRY